MLNQDRVTLAGDRSFLTASTTPASQHCTTPHYNPTQNSPAAPPHPTPHKPHHTTLHYTSFEIKPLTVKKWTVIADSRVADYRSQKYSRGHKQVNSGLTGEESNVLYQLKTIYHILQEHLTWEEGVHLLSKRSHVSD